MDLLKKTAQETLDLPADEVATLVEKFLQRQELKGKMWEDDADMVSHCVSWIEKRLPRPASGRRAKTSDHDARMAEYERTKAAASAADETDRHLAEWQRLKRMREDLARHADENTLADLDAAMKAEQVAYWKSRRKEVAS